MNRPAFPFDESKNATYLDVARFLAENPTFVENGITSAEQIIIWYQAEGYKAQCKFRYIKSLLECSFAGRRAMVSGRCYME